MKEHHSAADWDFSQTSWQITTADFVGPPSSLRIWSFSKHNFIILCKNAPTLRLPQGRIQTYLKDPEVTGSYHIYFRNTALPGVANRENCYFFTFAPAAASFSLQEEYLGDMKRAWTSSKITWPQDQWSLVRVSWWETWGLLMATLELYVAPNWVLLGSEFTIPEPLFGSAPYQRAGMGNGLALDHHYIYFDDTQIFEGVP